MTAVKIGSHASISIHIVPVATALHPCIGWTYKMRQHDWDQVSPSLKAIGRNFST